MIKYSFIVPVYNTQKYLKKCLDSLVNQTFNDFEIIIVNDGSTDKSNNIISSYEKKYKNIKIINQENQGLSMARNNGVRQATGKYIIFVDSDDYVEIDLLKQIDNKIDDNEILRFQIITEDEDGSNKNEFNEEAFSIIDGPSSFKKITSYRFVEPACCYVFLKDFWIKNKFLFKKGVYHEDFGLIPYVIYRAKKVCSISYIGYHYVQRTGSIMNNSSYDKTIKKAFDMLDGYINLKNKIKVLNKNYDNYFLSYIANSAVVKAKELKPKERKKYIKILKENNVFDDVLINSFSRKIKKILMKISIDLYLKVIK